MKKLFKIILPVVAGLILWLSFNAPSYAAPAVLKGSLSLPNEVLQSIISYETTSNDYTSYIYLISFSESNTDYWINYVDYNLPSSETAPQFLYWSSDSSCFYFYNVTTNICSRTRYKTLRYSKSDNSIHYYTSSDSVFNLDNLTPDHRGTAIKLVSNIPSYGIPNDYIATYNSSAGYSDLKPYVISIFATNSHCLILPNTYVWNKNVSSVKFELVGSSNTYSNTFTPYSTKLIPYYFGKYDLADYGKYGETFKCKFTPIYKDGTKGQTYIANYYWSNSIYKELPARPDNVDDPTSTNPVTPKGYTNQNVYVVNNNNQVTYEYDYNSYTFKTENIDNSETINEYIDNITNNYNYYYSSDDSEGNDTLKSIEKLLKKWYGDWSDEADENEVPQGFQAEDLLLPLIFCIVFFVVLFYLFLTFLNFLDYITHIVAISSSSNGLPEYMVTAVNWLKGTPPEGVDPFYIINTGSVQLSCHDFMVIIFQIAFIGIAVQLLRRLINNIDIPQVKR